MAFILKQKCNSAFFAATLALLHNSSDGIVAGLNLKVQMKLASTNQNAAEQHAAELRKKVLAASKRAEQRLAAAKGCDAVAKRFDAAEKVFDWHVVDLIAKQLPDANKRLQDQKDANTLISFAQHCAEEYNGIDRNRKITTRREKRQAIINLLRKMLNHHLLTGSKIADSLVTILAHYVRPEDHVPVVGDHVPKWRKVVTKIAVSNKRAALVQESEDPLKYKHEFYDAIVVCINMTAEDIVDVFPRVKVEKVDDFFRNRTPSALHRMARDLKGNRTS